MPGQHLECSPLVTQTLICVYLLAVYSFLWLLLQMPQSVAKATYRDSDCSGDGSDWAKIWAWA